MFITLANYVKSLYAGTQGENNLYYHDSTLENGAGDSSYRYAGAHDEVNNFVCFGSDDETCPDDNLYRIIGVFGDQVKLIKWDYAISELLGTDGDYSTPCSLATYCKNGTSKGINEQSTIGAYWWNYDGTTYGTNTWSASELNKVNLNTNYINNIGSTWANKIADTTWIVGGNTYANIVTSAMYTVYQNEIASLADETTYQAKIGLMYVSDYGYAASPAYWGYLGYNASFNDYSVAIESNWMYMGLRDWTIVRKSDDSCYAFFLFSDGNINTSSVGYLELAYAVRPVFYLNSNNHW